MTHSFDTEIAEKVGVNAAILLKNIEFWISKNEANGKGEINGYTWTYNSVKAWGELFPYMGAKQIRNALQKLRDEGYITWETGINPDDSWDKTAYYRLVKEANGLSQNGNVDLAETVKSSYPKGASVNKTDNKQQIINTDNKQILKNSSLAEKYIAENQQDDINVVEWFIAYRKTIKKSIKTIGPIKRFMTQYNLSIENGYDQITIFKTVKDREWQTVELEWLDNLFKKNENGAKSKKRSPYDLSGIDYKEGGEF